MKRKIITTADGSKTIKIEDWDEQYHSIHGAIQESQHVFIKHGLQHFCTKDKITLNVISSTIEKFHNISILEIGFGTGLNAFLTLLETQKSNININYVGVEAYPITKEEITQLNYAELISSNNQDYFDKLHNVSWEKEHQISPNFKLLKRQQFFSDIKDINQFDIIYFDAFGAKVQPELWTEVIFNLMYNSLKPNGVLVTYSAKGSVRRAMQNVNFIVERLPGPPGKREMLRAFKKA